jgi:nicotinate-nucleotide adenylyltransferase
VGLVRTAKVAFPLERLLVLVSVAPGHKQVATPAQMRLELARAAFPDEEVVLDEHARTVDLLRDHPEWADPIFLLGADEFCDFASWKDPDDVLSLARLGVATRPGYPQERLQSVLARLARPDRVAFFEIEPSEAASRDVRSLLERGEDVGGAIPPAVLELIEREGLYGGPRRYTQPA